MKFLCKLLGHKQPKGYYGTQADRYLQLHVGPTDGIGRVHGSLFTECERCDERYQVGMIHVPTNVRA